MRIRSILIAAAVVAIALSALVTATQAAPSAERFTFWAAHRYCEGNVSSDGTLGKAVCRAPEDYWDYTVSYYDFDHSRGTVFIDKLTHLGNGRYHFDHEQMSIAEWNRLFR